MRPYWLTKNRNNKFGNIPKSYGGRIFHSTLEADYAEHLDFLKKAGEIKDYQTQPRFPLKVKGIKISTIIPDFLIINKYGGEEIHETKSPASMTPVWQIKWRLLKVLYPTYKFYIIKRGDF